jgi:chromate reductase, NAD(P)H dehydrogenase (quinone)
MSECIHWLGISGNLKKEPFDSWILQHIQEVLPENVELELTSIADIPVYEQELDLPQTQCRPAPVEEFREALSRAEGIIIVSPEYNYGNAGGLKNAFDWVSRDEESSLHRKPVALLGATPDIWGTVRMQAAFEPLFELLDTQPVFKPQELIEQAKEKFDSKGNLKDPRAKDVIRKKLNNLKMLCENCKEMLTGAFQA